MSYIKSEMSCLKKWRRSYPPQLWKNLSLDVSSQVNPKLLDDTCNVVWNHTGVTAAVKLTNRQRHSGKCHTWRTFYCCCLSDDIVLIQGSIEPVLQWTLVTRGTLDWNLMIMLLRIIHIRYIPILTSSFLWYLITLCTSFAVGGNMGWAGSRTLPSCSCWGSSTGGVLGSRGVAIPCYNYIKWWRIK